jgi:hypothetical protein
MYCQSVSRGVRYQGSHREAWVGVGAYHWVVERGGATVSLFTALAREHDIMGAPIVSAAVTRMVPAKPKPNKRRAHVQIDKRFAIGRRVKQLTATFRERLGLDANPDLLLLAAIERAAQLQALAEQAAARALRGDVSVAYDDVVRLSRLAEHAVRKLHLDRNNTKQAPTLADYLVARGGSAP